MSTADDIKDILELTRNVAFGCGIVALLGMAFYEPEAIGITQHARLVVWTITAVAVGYIALSIAQFELRHPLLRAPLARQRALGIVRLVLMILVSEGAAICVGAHVDWQYRQQVATAKKQGRAAPSATYGTVTDAK